MEDTDPCMVELKEKKVRSDLQNMFSIDSNIGEGGPLVTQIPKFRRYCRSSNRKIFNLQRLMIRRRANNMIDNPAVLEPFR